MSLLSPNDRKALRNALREGREMSLERAWADGSCKVRATVTPASPAWDVPYILRIERWKGGVYSSQYVERLEERGRTIERVPGETEDAEGKAQAETVRFVRALRAEPERDQTV